MKENNISLMEIRPSKKEAQQLVFAKLSDALSEYRGKLKEKKFESKLKKASKLFAVDIRKAIKKDYKVKLKQVNGNG